MALIDKPVVILGGGISGLVAAYDLCKAYAGRIMIVEKEAQCGGLLREFEFDTCRLPVTYHHIMEHDRICCDFLDELGIKYKLKNLFLGVIRNNRFRNLQNPIDILSWNSIPTSIRLRMFFTYAACFSVRDPARLNNYTCREWFRRFLGDKGFDLVFAPLLKAKFGEKSESISAEWLVRRLKFKENRSMLGYPLEGMSSLTGSLERKLKQSGEEILSSAEILKIKISSGKKPLVTELIIKDQKTGKCQSIMPGVVLSTLPAPLMLKLLDGEAPELLARALSECEYMGCVTGIFGFSRHLGKQYCTYLQGVRSSSELVFDHSVIRQADDLNGSVLYLSMYMDIKESLWENQDSWFVESFLKDAEFVYPGCTKHLIWSRITRFAHAKLIYRAGYRNCSMLNDRISVENLFVAGTSLFPLLRNIGYTIALARRAAAKMNNYLKGSLHG